MNYSRDITSFNHFQYPLSEVGKCSIIIFTELSYAWGNPESPSILVHNEVDVKERCVMVMQMMMRKFVSLHRLPPSCLGITI